MAPRRLIVSFVLLLLLPAAAIVWLGVRLLEQDRSLESRQLAERRASACQRVAAALEQALAATERQLGSLEPDGNGIPVTFSTERTDVGHQELPASVFAAGEDLEFDARDSRRTAAAFQPPRLKLQDDRRSPGHVCPDTHACVGYH